MPRSCGNTPLSATSWRSRQSCSAMVRWSWPFAGASSLTPTTPTMCFRLHSSFWRKAGALWVNDSLGGWLHRVACRIAMQVKSDAVRRRERERRAVELAGTRNSAAAAWDDLSAVLHQEIDRLPERFRKPIVLCYLEEMTYQEAATQLRLSHGTTRGRLARGKELLRARLTSRGVTLTGAALVALPGAGRAAAVATAMVHATVRAARHFVLGEAAAVGAVSTATTALVNHALHSMLITKLKLAGAAALGVGMLAFVVSGLGRHRGSRSSWVTLAGNFQRRPGLAHAKIGTRSARRACEDDRDECRRRRFSWSGARSGWTAGVGSGRLHDVIERDRIDRTSPQGEDRP